MIDSGNRTHFLWLPNHGDAPTHMYYTRHQRFCSATHEFCAAWAKSGREKGKKTPTTELNIFFLDRK